MFSLLRDFFRITFPKVEKRYKSVKFAERLVPIEVYTSGKGSSTAGLTPSILRDPVTRNFIVEGGAMVRFFKHYFHSVLRDIFK